MTTEEFVSKKEEVMTELLEFDAILERAIMMGSIGLEDDKHSEEFIKVSSMISAFLTLECFSTNNMELKERASNLIVKVGSILNENENICHIEGWQHVMAGLVGILGVLENK